MIMIFFGFYVIKKVINKHREFTKLYHICFVFPNQKKPFSHFSFQSGRAKNIKQFI